MTYEVNGIPLLLPSWASADRFKNFQLPILQEVCDRYDDGHDLVILDAPTGCLSGSTEVAINRGGYSRRFCLEEVVEKFNGGYTLGGRGSKRKWKQSVTTHVQRSVVTPKWGPVVRLVPLVRALYTGEKETFVVSTTNGREIRATVDHGFALDGGALVRLSELRPGDPLLVNNGQGTGRKKPKAQYRYIQGLLNHPNRGEWPYRQPLHRLVVEAARNEIRLDWFIAILRDNQADVSSLWFLSQEDVVHHRDENTFNNELENLEVHNPISHGRLHGLAGAWANVAGQVGVDRVASIDSYGTESTFDLTVADDPHVYLANEFVVQNSGKSLLAYMVHQYLGSNSVILTSQKTLQHQYAKDFDTALLMGRSNYFPQNREPDATGAIPTCADCDLDNKTKLCSYCPAPEMCEYPAAREFALFHPFANLNYAYFLGFANSRKSPLSDRELVIADECDVLEQEIMGHVSIDISQSMQRLLGLRPPEKKTVVASWSEWFEYAIPLMRLKHSQIDQHSKDVRERRRKTTLGRLLENMEDIRDHVDEYVYTGYDNDRIQFKPVTVDRIAPKVFWPHRKRFLAMSATVVSPEEFVASLGYEGSWAPVFAPSTFPKERRPINFIPTVAMTSKTEATAWPASVPALQVVMDRHPDERILVHTVSKNYTRFLLEAFSDSERPVLGYTHAGERQEVIDQFEETPGAVLFAMSLGRGYDGKDDLVRVIVLAKVPYASLGDKQVSTRLRRDGGQFWYDVSTARTIVQMVGRGMRHEEDSCTTYITDSMFSNFYGKWSRGKNLPHRLFPGWFTEALDFNSTARFEIRQEMKQRTLQSAP